MKKWYKITTLSLCVLLAAFFAYPQCQDLFFHLQINLKKFILLKGDYEQLYETSARYRMVKEIKNALPDNAPIALSSPTNQFGFNYIFIRYHLYPCIISPNWGYFIDIDHSMPNLTPSNLRVIQLSSGVRIFAKENFPWHKSNQNYHGKLLSKNLFLFFGLSFWIVLIGWLILKAFAVNPTKGNSSWFFSSAYLLGLLVFCIPLWGILMLGVNFNQTTVISLMTFLTLISYFCSKSKVTEKPISPSVLARSTDKPKNLSEYCSNTFCVLIILMFMGIIISIPISVWDEMLIWIIKARVFCTHQGLDFSYTGAANNYYPILWPLDNAVYFLLIGDYDEISKWLSALTFMAFISQLKGCLYYLSIKRYLLWPLVIVYLIFFHHWTFYTALPENLFMTFLTAMASCIIMWFKDPAHSRKHLALGLIMASGLTLVKFEGAIIACLGGLALILTTQKIPIRIKDYLLGGWFLILLIIPWGWSVWVKAKGYEILWYHMQGRFSFQNINIMISIIENYLMKTRMLFLIVPVLLSLCLVPRNRERPEEERFLLFWLTTIVLFSFTAGLFWPSYDLQKYYPEVFSRLLVRATPALMLVWAIRLFRAN